MPSPATESAGASLFLGPARGRSYCTSPDLEMRYALRPINVGPIDASTAIAAREGYTLSHGVSIRRLDLKVRAGEGKRHL